MDPDPNCLCLLLSANRPTTADDRHSLNIKPYHQSAGPVDEEAYHSSSSSSTLSFDFSGHGCGCGGSSPIVMMAIPAAGQYGPPPPTTAKDSGIDDDCEDEEEPAAGGPGGSHFFGDTSADPSPPSTAVPDVVDDVGGVTTLCHAMLCFLPDLSGFKGLILSQIPPSARTRPTPTPLLANGDEAMSSMCRDYGDKNFEVYIKRLLNPLWKTETSRIAPGAVLDKNFDVRDYGHVTCFPNHVIIGKRLYGDDDDPLRCRLGENEWVSAVRKSRISLPTLLPSMSPWVTSMYTIPEQSVSTPPKLVDIEGYGGNETSEGISFELGSPTHFDGCDNDSRTPKDVSGGPKLGTSTTVESSPRPKQLLFSVDVVEHDTNYTFKLGTVALCLSKLRQSWSDQSYNVPPPDNHIPPPVDPTQLPPITTSTNTTGSDGTDPSHQNQQYDHHHNHIHDLLTSHPQLFQGSVSSPELSSMYRAKRSAHGDFLAASLKDLSLSGPNLSFATRYLYKSDRANLLIARTLSKDLVDKGCYVCAGPMELKLPSPVEDLPLPLASPNQLAHILGRKLSLPVTAMATYEQGALGDKKCLVGSAVGKKKRFPDFLANYDAGKNDTFRRSLERRWEEEGGSEKFEGGAGPTTSKSLAFDRYGARDDDFVHNYF